MTRARDELHLVMPHRFYVHQQRRLGDRHVTAVRTRFIPPALLPLFEERRWLPARAAPTSGLSDGGSARVDVAARLREMWR